MSVENNGPATWPGGVTGRGFLPGQSGNPGGRPKGLGAAARAAVGDDGHALIDFFMSVLRGDGRALGVRQVPLAARLDAARWLADRAFGNAPQVIAVADIEREEREQKMAELRTITADFTAEEKATLKAILMARRERYLAQQRAEAEAVMRSFMPNPPSTGETSERRPE